MDKNHKKTSMIRTEPGATEDKAEILINSTTTFNAQLRRVRTNTSGINNEIMTRNYLVRAMTHTCLLNSMGTFFQKKEIKVNGKFDA
jgi:hypothetical protein